MAYTGGDILEVTCLHPTEGLVRLDPKGSEDTEMDFGGYINSDSDDSVTGSGINIIQKNRKRWSVAVPPVGWDKDPDTLEVLQSISDSGLESEWTITVIDGTVFKGKGTISGDLKGNKNTGLVNSFKISGGGKLERIA
jgi:hypothetical protein